ncbi:hypothetical protein ACFXKG_18270 [Streptomyces sp. NPDC059255]|uniref:hypothetical protein n=1 Tax=Streptomyces sp. NPDC059255 TaxID=3346793 RepID=UPI0036A3723C
MTGAMDSYLEWDLLAHEPDCASPAWTIDTRTEYNAYRLRHDGVSHDCRNQECGHGDNFARTTLRIVCSCCGAAYVMTGEETPEATSTQALGYGQPPRRIAGLYLYPGEPLLHGWGESAGPHDQLVTARRVPRLQADDVIGQITQSRGKRGAVRWSACAVPSAEGTYGIRPLRWTRVEVDFRSVAAAAKWIAARHAERAEGGDPS